MGHHNRHFAGDPHALDGAWSPPTSTANFCEEDYAVTRYIAEFINTLTNLAYIYLALCAIFKSSPNNSSNYNKKRSEKTDNSNHPKPPPPRPKTINIDSMSLTLLILGLSSLLFHATLRLTLQYADELSMLALAWSLLQTLLTIRAPSCQRTHYTNLALALIFPLFSAFYIYTGEIVHHAAAFGLVVVLIVLRGHYLFYWMTPRFPGEKRRRWRREGRRALWLFLAAYALWNVDLEFCAALRGYRGWLGVPWAWVLELHGWWHVMTAVSAAWWMEIVREVREEEGKEE